MLSAINKIFEKLNIKFLNNSTSSKRTIVNKNSPNYGHQYAGDYVQKVDLSHKSRSDVRNIHIEKIGARTFSAKATYIDGERDEKFKVYWYGWQNIEGRQPVWTYLDFSNTVDIGQDTKFISVSAWLKDCPEEQNAHSNLSKEFYIGDKL